MAAMRLHILFGQRKESYSGEHAPEPLLCWSEWQVEENPDHFDNEVDEATNVNRAEFESIRLFIVVVDQDEIRRRLLEAPKIIGMLLSTP